MISHVDPDFTKSLRKLPKEVQAQARRAYKLFKDNPYHPSLHFKRVSNPDESLFSARVGVDYRALGTREGDEITWFWIGTHADYDKLLK